MATYYYMIILGRGGAKQVAGTTASVTKRERNRQRPGRDLPENDETVAPKRVSGGRDYAATTNHIAKLLIAKPH
jgi:hypothetical protein